MSHVIAQNQIKVIDLLLYIVCWKSQKNWKVFSRWCKGQKGDLIKHENGTERQPINAWYWVTMSIHLCCWCWMGPQMFLPNQIIHFFPFFCLKVIEKVGIFFLTVEPCLLDSLDYIWPLWTQYYVRNHQWSITKKTRRKMLHIFFFKTDILFLWFIWASEFY